MTEEDKAERKAEEICATKGEEGKGDCGMIESCRAEV